MNRMKTAPHRRQQGVTLIIALIMLVAMTMAGIVMFRQIGTGVIIARNLTFRQGATISADRGVEAARAWLMAQEDSGALEQPIVAQGYYPAWCNISVNAANMPDDDGDGVGDGVLDNCGGDPTITPRPPPPTTFVPADYNWANSVLVTADDGAGNEVRYVLHRLCHIPGGINISQQQCVTISGENATPSPESDAYKFPGGILPYYRVTTRVVGPMNAVAYTQATLY